MIRLVRLLLVAATAACLVTTPANSTEKRVALVVGVDKYRSLRSLSNPVRDAKAIADLLRSHDFDVTELQNPDFLAIHDALSNLEGSGAAEAVVYFAGHGFSIDKGDILAPADIEVDCEKRTARRSVKLEDLLERIEAIPNKLVLLDACRNDPFPTCPKRGADGSSFRGLSRAGSGQTGLQIASSTLTGSLAGDGEPGEHSPFAKAFLRHARTNTKVPLGFVLDLASRDVAVETDRQQIPEVIIRGGAPQICLDAAGCGLSAGVSAAPAPGPGDGKAEQKVALGKAPNATRRQTRSIVVGVDEYTRLDKKFHLQGAVNDARDVADALGRVSDDVIILENAKATRASILSAFNEAIETLERGDALVFFFSGHAMSLKELAHGTYGKSDSEKQDQVMLLGGFAPEGGNEDHAILDDVLTSALERASRKGIRILAIVDASHSGGLLDRNLPGVSFFAAAPSDGVASEVNVDGAKRGPLSWAVANAIRGDADRDKDGKLTPDELVTFVSGAIQRVADRPQQTVLQPESDDKPLLELDPGRP